MKKALIVSGFLAEIVSNQIVIPYGEIPHFPLLKHRHSCKTGQVVIGNVGNISVIFFTDMLHYYDGYTIQQCVIPVRISKHLGVFTLILANTANSVNLCTIMGDIVFIKDHFNLMDMAGHDPLEDTNDEKLGRRFTQINSMYDPTMVKQAKDVLARYWHLGMFDGVYAFLPGPSLETANEIKMLNKLDVDIVGMSTVLEVIAAKHCGMSVMAFSLITGTCSEYNYLSTDVEFKEVFVNQYAPILQKFLERFIKCHVKQYREPKCTENRNRFLETIC